MFRTGGLALLVAGLLALSRCGYPARELLADPQGLSVTRLDDGAASSGGEAEASWIREVEIGGENLTAITPPLPSRVQLPVVVPDRATLDFDSALITQAEARRPRVVLQMDAAFAGGRARLFREELRVPEANRWRHHMIDLAAWSGQSITLELTTLPLSSAETVPWADRVTVAWADLRVRSREPVDDSQPWGNGEEKPSFVFLLVDALRPDYLGAYGFEGDVSPGLDRLAYESLVFEQAYSHAPWTKPALATLFTSLYPETHGVADHEGKFSNEAMASLRTDALPDEAMTLAEVLREEGYRTGAFVANPWLSAEYGFDQGFERYELHESTESLLRAAREWLGEQSSQSAESGTDRPFFAYLHFMDVHGPFDVPRQDYQAMLSSPSLGPSRRLTKEEYAAMPDYLKYTAWATEEERYALRGWRAKYAAGVRAFDRRITPFLDALRSSRVLDRAYLILTSDHGEELFDHGGWDHGYNLHDHQLHVPLLVRKPGASDAGRRSEGLVGLIDLMPTILSLAEVSVPPTAMGDDLSPILEGNRLDAEAPIFATATKRGPGAHAIRSRRYKLLYHTEHGPQALFDVVSDPGENVNLVNETREVAGRLRKQLLSHLAEVSGTGALAPGKAPVPERLRRRLESLGYLR